MVKELYWKLIPYSLRPETIWYAFTCWIWHRYSTIKSRYLDHQWVGYDELLAHSMFEVLCRFVEADGMPYYWDDDAEFAAVKKEILDLYRWWYEYNVLWPKLEERLWDKLDPFMFEVSYTDTGKNTVRMNFIFKSPEQEAAYNKRKDYILYLEDRLYTELNENLIRILKIRYYLDS